MTDTQMLELLARPTKLSLLPIEDTEPAKRAMLHELQITIRMPGHQVPVFLQRYSEFILSNGKVAT